VTFNFFTLFGLSDLFLATAIVCGGGFLYEEFQRDQWARLNRWADGLERKLLKRLLLDYDTLGNPITWAHHVLNSAIVSLLGVGLAHATDTDHALGAFAFSCGMVVFYLIREWVSAAEDRLNGVLWLKPHFTLAHPFTSKIVDHVGDVVGPVAYAVWLWTLL